MAHFIYKKDDGSVSEREVIAVGFNFDDRHKVLCIDLSQYQGEELTEKRAVVEKIRRDFINAIKEAGLDKNYRQFFIENIMEVS